METRLRDGQIPTGWRSVVALLILAALLAGPIAVVATKADLPRKDGSAVEAAAAAVAPIANSGDAGPFAFGYVEFDWDPRAAGGVPGFDSWPPAQLRR